MSERLDMATTQEILDAAKKVGKLIAEHSAAKKMDELMHKLQTDREAQRALTDYNRQMQAIQEKQATGRPIEVEDKRKLEQFQSALAMNPTLGQLQTAQIDYLELMRQVDDAIDNAAPVPGTGPAAGAGGAGGQGGPGGPGGPGVSPLITG
ncbi:MAG: YlbF family regulator [Phycisphaeraceae bacterium]